MKLMIASDIHGSARFCRLLMENFEKERADRLLLLGDLLYHGPRNDLPAEYDPKSVIEMLNGMASKILAVRGNCESEVDQMVLRFPVMADYAVLFERNRMIYLTHGHRSDHSLLPFAGGRGDILLHGHTHTPACEERAGYVYLNPGSVSIPKGGTRHSYMILEDGVFRWKELAGAESYMEYSL